MNTGVVTVGNMGGKHQWNYTVIGDEVNLASRLEGVNKEFGSGILISESTRKGAGDGIVVRRVGKIRVKGKQKAVNVFELVGLPGEVTDGDVDRIRRFEAALTAFHERKWDDAEAVFRVLLEEGDRPSNSYLHLCHRYRQTSPPEGWQGEYVMEKK
jgi:adenylate cyclase